MSRIERRRQQQAAARGRRIETPADGHGQRFESAPTKPPMHQRIAKRRLQRKATKQARRTSR